MTTPSSQTPDDPSSRSRRPWPRWALPLLAVALFLSPAVAVAVHAVVPPAPTLLMIEGLIAGRGLDYRWRGLDRISPRLVEAVIAAEDARFCAHQGFDLEAIDEARRANRQGGRLRGASTLSQQTAKNVFLWPGRGWIRKGLEATFTVAIELFWTKRRIVEVYLNVAEFAPGVYGAEAAARHWFGVPASELTPTQAARLAAVLPSPRRYRAANPGPYVRRRSGQIQAAMATVREQGLDDCVQP